MGAKHSKRSMDVTTTPKKEGLPAEGVNAPAVCEGKLERIEETDAKPTTNGVAPHTDVPEEKDAKDKDVTTEKEKEQSQDEETKVTVEETSAETPAESPAENAGEVTTPTETPAAPTSVTSPDSKESKKKDKKKKWSFRSISFSKKDKNKPVREDSSKNGDVSKEEPLSEGGEDAENVTTSPADDKSAVSSPTTESAVAEAKEEVAEEKSCEVAVEEKASSETAAAPSSPADPTPVPVVDANKEEVEKIVEVSRVEELKTAAAPVEITKPKSPPIVAPSIIERKTSEDFPSLLPSSPPPTPIDPSPLQQAQQAAANASALAEALKLPAEATEALKTASEKSDSVKPEERPIVDIAVEELETLPIVQDQDIVIETEEGPVPISSDSEAGIKVEIIEPEASQEEKHLVDDEVIIVSDISLSGTINEQDNDAATEIAITEIPEDESLSIDKTEEEIPPPLPDSPIPLPKASVDLLNFMTSQIDDASQVISSHDNVILREFEANHEEIVKSEVATSEELPAPPVDVSIHENTTDSVTKSPIESLLTPPRSPSPLDELNGHDSINSYDCKLERLNETFSEEITPNDHSLKHNMQTIDQSIAEPEIAVENNQVTNDSTTENIEEAPKCPSVTAEAPVITSSPPVGPAITEDVASVTKAIEEIDINEKAVAMAVNENIESINTNEIIADMNHQNTLKE